MQNYDPSLQALTQRVAKLETQNRRLKKTGVAAMVLVSVVLFMGQVQTNRVLDANAFHLKDASGKVRARLSMEFSRPTLDFLDAGGLPVATLAGGDEPFLVLNRPGTTEQIQLGANKTFFGLALYEKEIRAGLSVQHGMPGVDFFDKSGQPQASFTAASLMLFDKNKQVLWSAP
jgi:hypothetical protein